MLFEDLVPGINIESDNTEFKGIIEEGKKSDGTRKEIGWLKTIAAYANTSGGDLYIGVENKSHKIVSLDHETADRIILMIHRLVKERIQPAVHYTVHTISVPGTKPLRYIIRIHVDPSDELPVTVKENGLLGIYVRDYGVTESATPEQIRDLVLLSESIPYDSPFTEESYSESAFSKLFQVTESRDVSITDKYLISIGFMSSDKKLSKGALLFRDDCRDSCTRISMTLWPEFTKGSDIVLANEVFTGDLLNGIQKMQNFVKDHSANGYRKEADRRVSYIAYPERSVTEGIVNAVAHRNYYIQGSQIEVNIFRDRLEITSPGSLLGVRKVQKETNISSITPRRRNNVICEILSMCRYMEQKESGFDKIEKDYINADQKHKPYISADGLSFTLTLPDLTYNGFTPDDNVNVNHIEILQVLNGKNDKTILAYCYKEPRTVSEIAAHLGIKPSSYFRKNTIARLTEEGLLIQKKEGKTSWYQSNKAKIRIIG